MILNSTSLNALRVGFRHDFMGGLDQAETQYGRIATTVPSTTKENKYGWLGKLPDMREWIGERAIHGIAEHDYSIKNVSYELTIGVDRDDIDDDNLGVYAPLMRSMGESVAAQPDMLCFGALKDGFTGTCYDGQNYFDTDHPVIDANGNEVSVSNTGGGAGLGWYLLSVRRSLKPIIFQERKKPEFVAMDNPDDPNVFSKKQLQYGTEARRNVGYGFWQMAFGSKQTLNKANYKDAREAILGMKGDYGRPLGLTPDLLVVPPGLEGEALEILNAERDAAGATNVYKGTAELLVTPWLA